jgi:diguanylate cyclase (GGDEF)-like protein/PAS domain S-box-containing protein
MQVSLAKFFGVKSHRADAETDFRALAENVCDIICRLDVELAILYMSPSVFDVLGWDPREIVGKEPAFLIVAEDVPVLAAAHADRRAHPSENLLVAVRMRKKDGAVVWTEVTARIVRDPITGRETETVMVIRDISSRKALEEELVVLASTDGLTGLANRRAFDENLEREWLRTQRERTQMSLLMLDLDHFKFFNDSYGHQMGDECLRAVAAVVRQTVRASDIACRYGGEEITVILPGAAADGAFRVAEAVQSAIEGLHIPHEANPGGDRLTASIGVATANFGDEGAIQMPAGLLAAADKALYKAKDLGRNNVATAILASVPGNAVTR